MLQAWIGIHLPFRPISQSQNELQEDTAEVEILQHCIDDWGDCVAKGKGFALVRSTGSSDKIHNDTGCEPEGS